MERRSFLKSLCLAPFALLIKPEKKGPTTKEVRKWFDTEKMTGNGKPVWDSYEIGTKATDGYGNVYYYMALEDIHKDEYGWVQVYPDYSWWKND